MTPEHGSKLDARLGTINQNEISIVERDTVKSVIPYKASVVKAHSFNAAKTV